MVSREAKLDLDLAQKLVDVGKEGDGFGTVLGKTISTNDFYEGQVGFHCKAFSWTSLIFLVKGRLDGAVCEYTEEDKMAYLHRVSQKVNPCPGDGTQDTILTQGVTNMEMEALVFASLTHKAGIRSAVVCVTLLDRLQGDQVDILRTDAGFKKCSR